MKTHHDILCFALIQLFMGSSLTFAGPWHSSAVFDGEKVGKAAEFVRIPAGEFQQGSPRGEQYRTKLLGMDDEMLHSVKISRDFEMQATPVTQLQYFLIMRKNPSYFKNSCDCDPTPELDPTLDHRIKGRRVCRHHPVEQVSWFDAQDFIQHLNELQNEYLYRLPTEAEWEYAAHGGMPGDWLYSFDNRILKSLDAHAWHRENSAHRTHAVGQKLPNPFGLFDMHGNVGEWVEDFDGTYPIESQIDPKGPAAGSSRIYRGGHFYSKPGALRSAARGSDEPEAREFKIGFRLVRTARTRDELPVIPSLPQEGSSPLPLSNELEGTTTRLRIRARRLQWADELEQVFSFESAFSDSEFEMRTGFELGY